MSELTIVPDLVGQPVHIARELAAKAGLGLAGGDPDGPGIGSRTWPGMFWVTAQDPEAGAQLKKGQQVGVEFVADGETRSGVPVGPPHV
ncbi:PASTA domain-containing protein [Microbacterium invictum]|uniref:PASTA domain-containing protein n=1 Tax=Microbacterium invictum TaxID=515415 RepID=A0ABZ0VCB0_9MICO|nr:PASTA domain-containing protein [Microbacterium invictum]WQB70869.1 PASTA domain-containing protein [Microbacterium invictum]